MSAPLAGSPAIDTADRTNRRMPPRAAASGRKPRGSNSDGFGASRDAQRRAALVLEVLAGVRTPAAAAEALGISLPRYYQVEARALGGLVAACEPRPTGRQANTEQQLAAMGRRCARLEREHARAQALVRAVQRSIGLAAPEKPGAPAKARPGTKGKRTRRPAARALRAVRALRAASGTDAAEHSGSEPIAPPSPLG
jgi:hypothetical protein